MSRARNFSERESANVAARNSARGVFAYGAPPGPDQYYQRYNNTLRRQRLQPQRPNSEHHGGHRGDSLPLWGGGPREPPSSTLGARHDGTVTLFIDELSTTATNMDLKNLFGKAGKVVDAFVSRKKRKNKKTAFGFVRYSHWEEAKQAIQDLNGHGFFGLKMRVSWARFRKGGQPTIVTQTHENGGPRFQTTAGGKQSIKKPILSPAFRDTRRYSDVLRGRKSGYEKQPYSKPEERTKEVVHISENTTLTGKLKYAVRVMTEKVLDREEIGALLTGLDFNIIGVSSLAPTKLVIFLEREDDVTGAIAETSPLRRIFTDVRKWSDEEENISRLVWLECKGVPPKCYSEENFQKIGDVWGRTMRVVDMVNGINSLTSAKLLVDTHIMHKIEVIIKVMWETGSRDVWVTELSQDESKDLSYADDADTDDEVDSLDQDEEQRFEASAECVNGVPQNGGDRAIVVGATLSGPSRDPLGDIVDRQSEREQRSLMDNPSGQPSMMGGIPSVDEWWGGPMSCPAKVNEIGWFDPIATIEVPISQGGTDTPKGVAPQMNDGGNVLTVTNQGRRPRGRPKRVACSLPDTLSVPSTPLTCSLEAKDTWQAATRLGIGCRDEGAVYDELRRSMRIQALEESTPASSR